MIISTEHIHISLKYIPDIQCWVVYHGISHKSLIVCHYLNINVEGRIWFWHGSNSNWNTLEMVYHVLDFGRNMIIAHNKKSGCNTIRYKIVFLNPDWLYFLQHGISIGYEILCHISIPIHFFATLLISMIWYRENRIGTCR